MATQSSPPQDYEPGKLFVGGLDFGTSEASLEEKFSQFGTVTECKIITDRDTGRSRGFGFIKFDTPDEADAARNAMQFQQLDGRTIRVDYASAKRGGGGGGSYGGGYGRGRGGFRGGRGRGYNNSGRGGYYGGGGGGGGNYYGGGGGTYYGGGGQYQTDYGGGDSYGGGSYGGSYGGGSYGGGSYGGGYEGGSYEGSY